MDYVNGICDGSIVANEYRIKACRRFLDDLQDERWDFKTSDAEFVIGIIELTICHQQGESLDGTALRGTPFLLMPFHKFIIYNLVGFKLANTSINRFTECLIFIPRKNVKTTFAGALAYALGLLWRDSGSKIYIVAAAMKQTMETFKFIEYNIRRMEEDDNDHEGAFHIIDNEEVKDFMQQVRSCIKEKRAIGNAGLIIPQNFLPMIKEVTEANSKLLKYTNKSDITGTARITIMGSVPEAVWTEQCGKLNELELGFNDVEMDGFKVAGFFKVCNALLEDNDVNLAQELINALGIAIAKAKDKAIVYGTGVKMPMGIVTRLAQTVKPSDHNDTEREWKDLHESNIKTITGKTGKELFKEIVRCLKMIFTDYDSGNLVWMMNRQTKLDLVVEAMDTNMNATIVSGMNDTMPVVGGKVEELKFMADGDIAFGYMTNYKAVQRKGLQLGQSEHVRFLEDQTVFKGTERFDGKPVIAEAFGLININGKTPTTSIVFAPDKANEEDVQLASLKIGSNKLFPVFSAGTYEYMVNTSNASSKIEAVAKRAGAAITIKNKETPVNNGESASFTDGENTLSITVSFAGVEKEYIVTVNKSAAA